MLDTTLSWAALIASIGSIATFIAFWFRLGSQIGMLTTKTKNNETNITVTNAKIDLVHSALNDHRLEAAKTFVTVSALTKVEEKLDNTLQQVSQRLDRMNERLDRVLMAVREGNEDHRK